jgi:holo-ACP synthase CitX
LRRLLASRDERAFVQRIMLGHGGVDFAVQVSLNVPGLPKRMDKDAEAVGYVAGLLFAEMSVTPSASVFLCNCAGAAAIAAFAGDPAEAKRAAVQVDEGYEWGRAFDIDVITSSGPLERTALGFEPRRCLLCPEAAKICALERTHGVSELREEIRRLLRLVPLRNRRREDNSARA